LEAGDAEGVLSSPQIMYHFSIEFLVWIVSRSGLSGLTKIFKLKELSESMLVSDVST
jgi:hypothetical protein